MAGVLIVGYGNPLRGDDGMGRETARRLALQYAGDSRVKVLSRHQLTPELADDIAAAGYVIFVDASEDLPPGLIARESLPAETLYRNSTHQGNPVSLVRLCLDLYGKCPPTSLIAVGGASFEVSQTLSPLANRTIPQVISLINEIVERKLLEESVPQQQR